MAEIVWNIGAVEERFRNFLADKMEVACELLETDMKNKTAGHQGEDLKAFDQGNYLNSFFHKVIVDAKKVVGIVFNTAEYAPYIEFGTGELAEGGGGRKGGWVYFDAKTGSFRFTKGMRPRPIMRSALEENKSKLQEFFNAK